MMHTSRSQIMSYQRCPYRRWLEYHYLGIGIVPDKVAVPLATGGAIHLGLQRLLEGVYVEEAVQEAIGFYKDAVAKAGFQDTHTKDQDYLIAEQFALVEVMVRAWALKRLPIIQAQYAVIEIEKEAKPIEIVPGIFMAIRPDGVLENYTTGYYETLSFKTAKQYGYKNDKSNIVDIQGISETWAVAQRYGEEKVGPVLMEFLVTGPRKAATKEEDMPQDALASDADELEIVEPVGAPLKYQWNPFIRAWRDNYGNVSWRFKMPDPQDLDKMPTMAKFFNPSYGKKGAKYEVKSFGVWEEMPVKEWFSKMAAREVFPQWCDPFEGMFLARKYNRMPFELKEWQREASAQEAMIAHALDMINAPSTTAEQRERLMAEVFPKYRHSCQYPTPCPFQKVCWEGVTDPLSAGFKFRTPNHPEEQPNV